MDLKSELNKRSDIFNIELESYLKNGYPKKLYDAARHLPMGGGKSLRPVISIISSDFVVKSEINETDVINLKVGQDVEITLDAYYEHKFNGKIINISPVSTNVGGVVSFEITIEIESENGPEVLYGMSASLTITTAISEDVLYVPIQYVYEEDGISYVDVLTQDGETIKTEVTTGTSNYDYIEIESGLNEGDTVIVSTI